LHPNAVAWRDAAGDDHAGEAAEAGVRAVDPLHRQAERGLLHARVVHLDGLEVADQRRAVVPAHRRARHDDVLASQRRHRDRRELFDADLGGEFPVILDNLLEAILGVVDEVHLVDGQHNVADAEQRDDIAVPACLRQHALARIHQNHRSVGVGRTGHHVAGVLLVAGGVGDDELAVLGGEESIRDVDRYALLALGSQAVDQQREVHFLALRAPLLGVFLDRGELVLEQQLGVVQHAPDQCALAIVDAAASDEAEQALALVLAQVFFDVGGEQVFGQAVHQK
jgi:hypothetical protein